jgi:hypothetical protein
MTRVLASHLARVRRGPATEGQEAEEGSQDLEAVGASVCEAPLMGAELAATVCE